ncbi:MAG: flagellin lysine-N-methylase [Clostridia bacterium]|nr:flagellin lysine-N-methylase [Clostridia bacterium]
MINTFPSYYKKFKCIADKCPDTCCAGWEIVVDPESLERYKALKGVYADKINSLITVDEDGDCIFISKEKRCPFLLESGLCEMHIKLGEESLCRTCRQFPRHKTYFGARVETGISLSCPEAARIITESPDPITFESEEIHAEILPTAIDPSNYFTLLEARKTAINILQSRNFSIEKRIIAFLEFSQAVQTCLRKKEFEKAHKINGNDFLNAACRKHSQKRAGRALDRYFSDFKSLEMLDTAWLSELEKAEDAQIQSCSEYEWEFEHMMIYFVFRYFMTAVFDGDLLTKSKLAAVSFIIIRRLQAENVSDKQTRIRAMQKYSKEVEHSAQNMEYLRTAMKKSRFYSVENIVNVLSLKEE